MDLKFEFDDAHEGEPLPLETMARTELNERADAFAKFAFAGKTEEDLIGTTFQNEAQIKDYYRAHFYKLMGSHFNVV